MQSVQESKQELEAAIRYAENAISSAKQTIESMEFRQEMAKKNHQEQTGREQALQTQVTLLEERIDDMRASAFEDAKTIEKLRDFNDELSKQNVSLAESKPTMPLIPKAVAIAIFREGMVYGAGNVCDELDNANDIEISDRECMGNFEVEFQQWVTLSDHLDLDWLRAQAVDNSDEEWVVDCLKTLMECADNKFECRIHGIDDNENKNDND